MLSFQFFSFILSFILHFVFILALDSMRCTFDAILALFHFVKYLYAKLNNLRWISSDEMMHSMKKKCQKFEPYFNRTREKGNERKKHEKNFTLSQNDQPSSPRKKYVSTFDHFEKFLNKCVRILINLFLLFSLNIRLIARLWAFIKLYQLIMAN